MKKDKKSQGFFVATGLLLLMLGLLYYSLFRDVTSLYLWNFPGVGWFNQVTNNIAPANYFSWFNNR